MKRVSVVSGLLLGLVVLAATPHAQGPNNAPKTGCALLPTWSDLKAALSAATAQANGLLQNHMWGTIVDRSGVVCAVAFTGPDRTNQWLGSR